MDRLRAVHLFAGAHIPTPRWLWSWLKVTKFMAVMSAGRDLVVVKRVRSSMKLGPRVCGRALWTTRRSGGSKQEWPV